MTNYVQHFQNIFLFEAEKPGSSLSPQGAAEPWTMVGLSKCSALLWALEKAPALQLSPSLENSLKPLETWGCSVFLHGTCQIFVS